MAFATRLYRIYFAVKIGLTFDQSHMKNWKTTVSGIGAAIMSLLGAIAALPYSLGEVATILPPVWKTHVAIGAFAASFILKTINSIVQKDAAPPTPSPTPDSTNKPQ